jgi:hypothetical protein
MHEKYSRQGSIAAEEIPPIIIHGPTSWEQHLRSKMHRRMRTNKAEMERDGANWWYFKAQEYKKRKREGTLNQDVETVGSVGILGASGKEEASGGESEPTSKARRTSGGAENASDKSSDEKASQAV